MGNLSGHIRPFQSRCPSARIDAEEQRLHHPTAAWHRADALQQVMRIWLVGRPDTVIGAYWPIKGRIRSPRQPCTAGRGDGELLDQPQLRRIGLPVVNKAHKTMTFHAWYPGCPMEDDAYGIPKPKDTELTPTLLFAPCVGYGLAATGWAMAALRPHAGTQPSPSRLSPGWGSDRVLSMTWSPKSSTSRWTPFSTTTAWSGLSVERADLYRTGWFKYQHTDAATCAMWRGCGSWASALGLILLSCAACPC